MTAFVISEVMFFWLLLFVLFIVQLALCIRFYAVKGYSARRTLLLSLGVNAVLQFILIAAMYAPIFKLGAVV